MIEDLQKLGSFPELSSLNTAVPPQRSAQGDFRANSLLIILHRMSNTGNNLEISMKHKFLYPLPRDRTPELELTSPFLPLPSRRHWCRIFTKATPKAHWQDPGQGIVPSAMTFQAHPEYPTTVCGGGVVTAPQVHTSFSRM